MDLLKLSKNAVVHALDKLIELDKKNIKDYQFSNEVPREVKAEADIIIEKILIDKLSISDLSILSEESGLIKSESNSNLRFIIDPIDGTVNFIRGICNCSISVALFDGNTPVFGVLASYPSGIIAWGGKGIGAFIGEMPINVSSIKDTKKGVLCTGFPSRFEFNSKTILKQIHLMQSFNKVRMLGSASQSLLQVAQGSVEAYVESNIMIWDIAAGIAIVEGAGGEFRINNEQDYNYPIANSSSANWTVTGGDLVNGQNTDTVSIKWGLNETGTISVRESNGSCFSEVQQFTIALSANQRPEDVSIARLWNEVLLQAIRNDFARPTIHARNLFHTSVAMYDVWAIYDDEATPYLIGNTVNNFSTELLEFMPLESVEDSRKKAISYAMYRLLSYRFQNSPNAEESQNLFDLVMEQLGFETTVAVSTLYQSGNAADLGNYVAETIITYGNGDGSRELDSFGNAYYSSVNMPLGPAVATITLMNDPNRWQPLSLDTFIDQSGNLIEGSTLDFLSPEWGNVYPFAMSSDDNVTYQRNGDSYKVYNDPSDPPYLNLTEEDASSDAYKLGFSMVSIWGSHLDPSDNVLWDISPAAIGNTDINEFPTNYGDYPSFYNIIEGGDIGLGHATNPITGQAYESQLVPRGDYTRVLAEFWADGPDSETPPGHWFTILNYVNEHPQLEKKFEGGGAVLDDLEWDVKSYFILGGAMHDSAISAWSAKGWYDYVRPISAIRNMALLGQSTDQTLDNYNVAGIPLLEGYVEVVGQSDPLRGEESQNIGKLKLYSWRGPDYIEDESTDIAGVGWILAENWWPYQRPTFVTPPFAGYVSGHSTYSRAASEVLTKITGSPFFPSGLGEFTAKQNDFLVFEQGPSVDIKLQWATYRDASDQTSLSRIWGGIHPPADDIPGRLMGEKVANDAFDFAVPYFFGNVTDVQIAEQIIYPNPVINNEIFITNSSQEDIITIFDARGRQVNILKKEFNEFGSATKLVIPEGTASGLYFLNINNAVKLIVVKG